MLSGRLRSREAPVKTFSDVVYLDVQLEGYAKALLPVEPGHELAVYAEWRTGKVLYTLPT